MVKACMLLRTPINVYILTYLFRFATAHPLLIFLFLAVKFELYFLHLFPLLEQNRTLAGSLIICVTIEALVHISAETREECVAITHGI